MSRWFASVASILFAISLIGCGGGSTTVKGPQCDLDLDNLAGIFVSMKGDGTGHDTPDPFARAKFVVNDEGKKQVIYTAGRLQEGNPATNKYTYDFVEKTTLGDLLYSVNMIPGKSKQRIERLKKDNRSLGMKFEGRLYIKINTRRCRVQIGDYYVTYVRGEETEDSNPTGTREYAQIEEDLSMVHCDAPRSLIAFDKELIDVEKDKALNPFEGIYALDQTWLHYLPPLYEDDELRAKQMKEAHITPEEGCTYDAELWIRDKRVEGKQKVVMSVDEKTKRVDWRVDYTFKKSSATGVYVELHRYKTCAGKRKLVGNACNVFKPNRSRAEIAQAEEEAKQEEEEAAKKKEAEEAAKKAEGGE
jgi:hypothetical protein